LSGVSDLHEVKIPIFLLICWSSLQQRSLWYRVRLFILTC